MWCGEHSAERYQMGVALLEARPSFWGNSLPANDEDASAIGLESA